MAHRSSLPSILNSPWTYLALCTACATVFFLGLYPGKLYPDTAVNIYNALEDNFGAVFPAIIGATFQIILAFDPSLTTIFLTQVATYWLGVFLLIWAVLRMSEGNGVIALALFLVALFPYCLNYQFLLLKDNWLLNSYLLFFGLFGLSMTVTGRRVLFIVAMALVAFNLILVRNAFLPLIIPLAMCLIMVGNTRMPLRISVRWLLSTLAATAVLTAILSWGATAASDRLSEDRRMGTDYSLAVQAARELIAMSVLDDHRGVTAGLSDRTKARLDRAYDTYWTWWASVVGTETKDLINELKDSPTVLQEWGDVVREHPLRYAKHRWTIFMVHFDASLRLNAFLINRKVPFSEARYQRIMQDVEIQQIENNGVWRAYALYIRAFFYIMPTMAWVPALSLLMLAWGCVRILKNRQIRHYEMMFMMMNIAAWSYMGPYLLMLSHAEARYVYPALCLVLFSIPYFLAHWWGGAGLKTTSAQTSFDGGMPTSQ